MWLNAEWWQSLDTDALAVYVSALMWSMGQGTDGDVSLTALQRATPLWKDDARFRAALAQIEQQGRGRVTGDRLILDDWEGKHAQTLHARIVRRRATSARSSRNNRERNRDESDEWGDESHDESHTERHDTDGRGGDDSGTNGSGDYWPYRPPGSGPPDPDESI